MQSGDGLWSAELKDATVTFAIGGGLNESDWTSIEDRAARIAYFARHAYRLCAATAEDVSEPSVDAVFERTTATTLAFSVAPLPAFTARTPLRIVRVGERAPPPSPSSPPPSRAADLAADLATHLDAAKARVAAALRKPVREFTERVDSLEDEDLPKDEIERWKELIRGAKDRSGSGTPDGNGAEHAPIVRELRKVLEELQKEAGAASNVRGENVEHLLEGVLYLDDDGTPVATWLDVGKVAMPLFFGAEGAP